MHLPEQLSFDFYLETFGPDLLGDPAVIPMERDNIKNFSENGIVKLCEYRKKRDKKDTEKLYQNIFESIKHIGYIN